MRNRKGQDAAQSGIHRRLPLLPTKVAEREWEDLWHEQDFENDYYFISQLFQHSWQPRETI